MTKRKNPRVVYRSSVTGKFVTASYANDHPDTTTREETK